MHAAVHGFDTREHCVYDLDGHSSQIAFGALLETIAIAASQFGWQLSITHRQESPESRPVFDLYFEAKPDLAVDPLLSYIERRTVQRRPMSTRALNQDQIRALENAVGPNFSLVWKHGFKNKLATAMLLFRSAKLRLTLPEAFEVHRSVIEWQAQFSADKIPDQALGSDPLTTRVMRFAMHSWERVHFLNRFLAGTWAPRLQLDLLPGLSCAAHFLMVAHQSPKTMDDYIEAGRRMQRLWLTVTQLGLSMQPEITPLVFSRYAKDGRTFSREAFANASARQIRDEMQMLVGAQNCDQAVFMGRIGHGPAATSRSLRRPLDELLLPNASARNV
ncbi:molybdopterin biosynthesis protein MoeY [Paucibacter sp. Y2R2-4]|uniref:molybdopterin biosynthesis protein MoeY n=1 Tax=Paucibacter sp. Y2R2-4 TaxID=2893553 RepID=UPI0021E38E2F|nr:molybdopterin biosynthesis protein MoeY [Paucibacter sp. Y2R2-4]MCV2348582.1 molybdopterin biosynthesis protein MoeY [Paucibacter sp. Y2R2-4]